MNKRTIFASLLAATLLTAPSCFAQLKVGTVSLEKVISEYYKTKDAQEKLKEVEKNAQKELDDRLNSFKALIEDVKKLEVEANKSELSKDKLDAAKKQFQQKAGELRQMEQEVNDFRQTRQRQLQDQMIRMKKSIIDEILKVVNEKVKSDGYDLVLDKSALSMGLTPVTVFAKDDMDFSAAIITALNKTAPKPTSAAQ